MATSFTMPQLGLTMTEGTVTQWFKAVGDTVNAGELLVEISTDKLNNQLESTASGVVLAIMVAEGNTAPVQSVLAIIGEEGEEVDIAETAEAAVINEEVKAPVAQMATAAATGGDWVLASPLARKLAKDEQIDLALVTGTGPAGRVVERDILNYQTAPKVKASPLARKIADDHGLSLATITAQGTRIMKQDVLAALTPTTAATGQPLTGMRKIIAERMSQSWQTAPHVHLTMEIDMTAAADLKETLRNKSKEKLSFTELFVKCAAKALAEFPMVNNSLIDGNLVENQEINIGIAVALDNGLIVPVIRQANLKSLFTIRKEIADLGGKAREGKLSPDEYTGGTFTVTNLGMFGVDHFTPVINPPESAILGICRIVERPVVVDGNIVIRPMLNACLAFDHRLIDGALAAQFMARLRQLAEEPLLLL